jgi:transketolase
MKSIVELEAIAKRCRDNAIIMADACGSGHLGGSFSIMDVLVALEFRVMKEDDVLVYSKAHCCEALYAVLAAKDVNNVVDLSFGEWGSKLQCHSEHWAYPEVEFSGGSLGQGLSYACGVALGKKRKGDGGNVYCIVGDGECQEGQIWEAMMFAIQYDLFNLILIIDYNKHTGDVKQIGDVMHLEPLKDKIESFGWIYKSANGNNMESVVHELENCVMYATCIVVDTVKGMGVTTWEKSCSHLQFGKELEEGIKEWGNNGIASSV